MQLSEKALDYLESHIPEMAAAAVQQAYWGALASGSSVLISKDGFIVEVFPDGTTQIIAKSEPWIDAPSIKHIELK